MTMKKRGQFMIAGAWIDWGRKSEEKVYGSAAKGVIESYTLPVMHNSCHLSPDLSTAFYSISGASAANAGDSPIEYLEWFAAATAKSSVSSGREHT